MTSRRVALAAAALAAGAVAAAAACSDFDSTESDGPDAGATAEGGGGDAAATDGASGDAAPDAGDASDEAGACRRIKGPGCDATGCAQKQLYGATGAYPFALTTDSTHVYWVEQRDLSDAGAITPYNGGGTARIVRATRAGSTTASNATVLVEGEPRAVAIASVGPYLYWTTYEDNSQTHVKRVLRSCTAPCSPEDVTAGAPIGGVKIHRIAPAPDGAVYLLGLSGHLYRYVAGVGPTLLTNAGSYPAMATTDDGLFAVAINNASVFKASLDGVTKVDAYAAVPAVDGGNAGFTFLVTDCTALYAIRYPGSVLWRMPLSGTALTPVGGATSFSYYALAVDGSWVYGAMPDVGGIVRIDKTTGGVTKLANGNVFDLYVDDLGVYWGDHAGQGEIMMMVK